MFIIFIFSTSSSFKTYTLYLYTGKEIFILPLPIQNPPSRVSTPFCFSTVVSIAAIKDIPPGNSKCRFMRNRGKHCFVYHCKELVPLMNTKTKFLQKIWPYCWPLFSIPWCLIKSNFGFQKFFLIHTWMI